MKARGILIFLLFSVMIFISACGGDDDNDTENSESENVSTTAPVVYDLAPAGQNLVLNGDFSIGEEFWQFFDEFPHQTVEENLQFYRVNEDLSQAVFQEITYRVEPDTILEAQVKLGNISESTKKIELILHDPDWENTLTCTFHLPGSVPLQTYTLQGKTSKAWSGVYVEISRLTADGLPALLMDDVTVQVISASGTASPEMQEPICDAPAPAGINLIRNGDFGSGEDEWQFWESFPHEVVEGVMQFNRDTSGASASVFQEIGYPIKAQSPVEVTIQLGNTSAGDKEVHFTLHNPEWSEALTCLFTIPAGSPVQTYVMRGLVGTNWSDIFFTVDRLTADGTPSLTMDNVSVRYLPELVPNGFECLTPE